MIKALWNAIAVLLLIHLLATLGFVAWLRTSGRLDGARLNQVVAMFKITIADQRQQLEDEEKQAAEQLRQREALARLEEVADGPRSVSDRLRTEAEDNEVALQKLELATRAVAAMRSTIESAKADLARRQTEDDTERQAFEKRMDQRLDQLKDENFRQAVSVYENLKPAQAKANFLELIKGGNEDQVVDYLAAMQLRKAAKVLAQFETPEDVTVSARLIQRLRERGIESLTAPSTERTGDST